MVKTLNQLERASPKLITAYGLGNEEAGKKYVTKQIPILKAEIEAAIKELQGE